MDASPAFIHCSNELYNPIFPDIEFENTIYQEKQDVIPVSFLAETDKAEMRRQVVIKHLHKQEALRVEIPDVESLSDAEILKRYQDKNVQRRLIVASWPRDPKGKYLPKTTGKYATEEKYPWGGTILDFFVVRSYPAVPHVIAFSTSSRLLEAMTLLGEEFEHATHCLNYAKAEKDPRLLLPYDTAKLILEDEKNIKNARAGKTLTQDSQWWIDDENFRTSIFDPSRCPVPWPIDPFSYQPAKLEKRLPFGLLPETLYVHASSRLLSASSTEDDSDDKPLVFKYRLKLTTEGKKKAEELKKETSENRDCYEYFPKAFFTGSIPPPVRALLPPRPPIERPKEAHLYMSADYRAGCGNHSYVYHAEWELPRDLLVPDVLCKKCIDDGVNQRIMKEDGGEDESQKNNKWKDIGGNLVARKHLLKGSRGYIVDYIANTNFGSIDPHEDHADTCAKENQYNGIYRPVESGAEYQNSSRKPYCPHIQNLDFGDFATHPLTARVRVAAKLSMEDDDHLEREASNYQRFPDYFFEQYSGYHLVPDLRQVIPVGAIVPQFYGYYVPDESCAQNNDEYLSPILLLEDCGSQIGDIALSIDDRHECAGLAHRFKHAGWNHDSIAPRNFLYQPGPLWKHPSERGIPFGEDGYDSAYSFRVIDFGRSAKEGDVDQRSFTHHYKHDMSDVRAIFDYREFPF